MQKSRRRRHPRAAGLACLVWVGGGFASTGIAEDARDSNAVTDSSRERPAPQIAPPNAAPEPRPANAADLYVPPEIGFPGRRIGAGTRGMGRLASLQILAPDHLGYTTLEQPTLYWYLSAPTETRIEFTLRDETSVEPLIETQLASPAQPGIQGIRLADYGVRLRPDVRYLWFVSLVSDPQRRSKDFTTGAWIARHDPDPALAERLAAVGDGAEGRAYAQSGLWYDAIAALSSRIEDTPADPAAREQRAALLEQVGLSEVATYDREAGAPR